MLQNYFVRVDSPEKCVAAKTGKAIDLVSLRAGYLALSRGDVRVRVILDSGVTA
jgi:hypothetical protein